MITQDVDGDTVDDLLIGAPSASSPGVDNSGVVYLEVGPGDCALAFEVAKHVNKVIAVDVSETITKSAHTPENFELIISDGCSIPVQPGSIDVVYSNGIVTNSI